MEVLIKKYGEHAFAQLEECLQSDQAQHIFLLMDNNRKNITGFTKRDGLYSIHLYRDRDFKQEILTASEDTYDQYLKEAIEKHDKYEVYETPKA